MMDLVTSLSLLIFVGASNSEGADVFPEIENNQVAALFTGGVVIKGRIEEAHVVPGWMGLGSTSPHIYAAYIRTLMNEQYKSTLEEYPVISLDHAPDNPEHGPTYAEIRVENVHFSARRFLRHEKPLRDYKWNINRMPRNNRIYITLPNGAIYESKLEPHESSHRPILR